MKKEIKILSLKQIQFEKEKNLNEFKEIILKKVNGGLNGNEKLILDNFNQIIEQEMKNIFKKFDQNSKQLLLSKLIENESLVSVNTKGGVDGKEGLEEGEEKEEGVEKEEEHEIFNEQEEKNEIFKTLKEEIKIFIVEIRKIQIERILEKEKLKYEQIISKDISDLLNVPNKTLWKDIRNLFNLNLNKFKKEENEIIFKHLNLNKIENESNEIELKKSFEHLILSKINDSVDFLSLKMHNKFDEEFRYSKGHIPRIFKSSKEIKIIFTKARNTSLQLINLFFLNRLKNDEFDDIKIKFPSLKLSENENENKLKKDKIEDQEEDEDDDTFKFPKIENENLILKNEKECKRLYQDFIVKIGTAYSDAQRTFMLHTHKTQIPFAFWVIAFILGWNEMVWIVTHPLYLLIFLIFGSIVGYNFLKPKIEEYIKYEISTSTRIAIKLFLDRLPYKLFDLDDDNESKENENENKKKK